MKYFVALVFCCVLTHGSAFGQDDADSEKSYERTIEAILAKYKGQRLKIEAPELFSNPVIGRFYRSESTDLVVRISPRETKKIPVGKILAVYAQSSRSEKTGMSRGAKGFMFGAILGGALGYGLIKNECGGDGPCFAGLFGGLGAFAGGALGGIIMHGSAPKQKEEWQKIALPKPGLSFNITIDRRHNPLLVANFSF